MSKKNKDDEKIAESIKDIMQKNNVKPVINEPEQEPKQKVLGAWGKPKKK